MRLLDTLSSWYRGWMSSIKTESQRWHLVCPLCGNSRSVWDSGGIRWMAAGRPRKLSYCRHCQRRVWARLEYRVEPLAETQVPQDLSDTMPQPLKSSTGPGCRLWIDGVGCWAVWFGDSLTIGGGSSPQTAEAEFAIQAPLSRKHAFILRTEEDYQFVPVQLSRINGERIDQKTYLPRRAELQLGDDVRLNFEVPSELSRSARLTCVSSHRPVDRSQGLILMCEHLLLGPGSGVHISCPQWKGNVILFRRSGKLWCQSAPELRLNDQPLTEAMPLEHGSVLTGQGLRLRLEVET